MSRREKLIAQALDGKVDETSGKMLDAVVKLVLGDLATVYNRFWETEGPGVMCFQPSNQDRSMFFLTLKELHSAEETCEQENNGDLAETFRRILGAAQKINPEEKAGYLINDKEGIRYLEIDYNQQAES